MRLFIIFFLFLISLNCNKDNFSSKPVLTFISATPTIINKSNIQVEYNIKDKEGDITDSIFITLKYLNKFKKYSSPITSSYIMPNNIPSTENLDANLKIVLKYQFDIPAPIDNKQNDTILISANIRDIQKNISDTAFSNKIIILNPQLVTN